MGTFFYKDRLLSRIARSLALQELSKKQLPKRPTRAVKKLEERQLKECPNENECPNRSVQNRRSAWFSMPRLALTILCSIAILRYCLVSEVIGPCPDTLVVSGGEGGPQSDYMGSYAKTSSPGGAYNGGRPIYKNSKNKYMFYWYATGKWFAGRDYNSDIVGLKSEADAAQCPHTSIRWDAMGWGADGKPSWAASSPVFVAEPMPCPDVVFAHGGEASHSIFMGNYTKTSIPPLANNGGRPIYANSNNQH